MPVLPKIKQISITSSEQMPEIYLIRKISSHEIVGMVDNEECFIRFDFDFCIKYKIAFMTISGFVALEHLKMGENLRNKIKERLNHFYE